MGRVVEAHFADMWEAIADARGDDAAIVQARREISWSSFDERAARLAGCFADAGLHPGSAVALFLANGPEYLESYFAALKIRAVPVNVNYGYRDEELRYLLDDAGAEALVFHRSLMPRVAGAASLVPTLRLLVVVDDEPSGTTGPSPTHDDLDAHDYEQVVSAGTAAPRISRSPDDVTMLYTGGTTGMPKGVVARVGPLVEAFMTDLPALAGLPPANDLDDVLAVARHAADQGISLRSLTLCPLMHGTGLQLGALPALSIGGTVVLMAGRAFDPAGVWETAERCEVGSITLVGDAFARPMVDALENGPPRRLGALRYIVSSGAVLSNSVKERLLACVPDAVVLDYVAASEGFMGVSIATSGHVPPAATFEPAPGVRVVGEDSRWIEPGSDEPGLIAVADPLPDGYHGDTASSDQTFRTFDGVRHALPGDWALLNVDGSITLLGRGSMCINTGGEKVFPEEVDEVLKRHPAVVDALVFGVPDERFGERVVGVVSTSSPTTVEHLRSFVAEHLAVFKVPRDLRIVAIVPRSDSGKPAYATAEQLWSSALENPEPPIPSDWRTVR
jgi:3-oxocholest-4-en-26-oate---CoA ligase